MHRWKLPLPPLASVEWLLGSCRHKKSLHSTYMCPSVCLYMCLCVTTLLQSSHFSPIVLSPSVAADRLGYDSRPPPSGLPLPHRLGAAVQFAPPGRGGCAAVAKRTVPVRGDFLFASAGLFVTQCDVTVGRSKERRLLIEKSALGTVPPS